MSSSIQDQHIPLRGGKFCLMISTILLSLCVAAGIWLLLSRFLAGDILYARAEMIYESIGEEPMGAASVARQIDSSPRQTQLRKANELVSRAVQLNPASERALLTHARNLSLDHKYTEAKKFAMRAHQALAAEANFMQLGWISLELGERKEAKKYFQSALALNPGNAEALERVVWISKLDLNKPNLANRQAELDNMLAGLWNLQRYAYFNPNLSYLWSQYWHERTLTSKNYIHYLAGFRTASQTDSRPLPEGRPASLQSGRNAKNRKLLPDGRPRTAN